MSALEEPQLESLSQRELRNESGRVLRAVAQGESFVLTNGGVIVGKIVPLDAPRPLLRVTRPAKRVHGWKTLGIRRAVSASSLTEIVNELREDRM